MNSFCISLDFHYLCMLRECKFNKMYRLNLPQYEIKIAEKDGKKTIFDILRHKYVALTSEEWVRQHFIHYIIEHKGFPKSLLANEVELTLGSKKLRCDSVLYDNKLRPRVIFEYKAPTIVIGQKVFSQISSYNLLLKVDYLVVSNGLQHYCCKMDYINSTYTFLKEIPDYEIIKQSKLPLNDSFYYKIVLYLMLLYQ